MTVELAKRVNDTVVQRARFTITAQSDQQQSVQIVIHHDDRPSDDVSTTKVVTTGDAYVHIYRTLVGHFTDYTLEELDRAEVTWNMAAYDDTPQEELDLAEMIAAAVMEDLEVTIDEFEQDLSGDDEPE